MKEFAKYSLGFFAALILLPGILKTAHILADHQHVACEDYFESHFHSVEVDCDIFHFQQTVFPETAFLTFEPFVPEGRFSPPITYFPDKKKQFREKISTRGPPVV